jgi:glycosyltransferase involved in cell wall biosynthesis
MGVEILHVISGLGTGGAESMLTSLLLAERQAASEDRVHVISLSSGGANAQRLRAGGMRVTELRMRPGNPPGWELFRLARAICLERPAIIQSWMYHADLAATLALYWSGRRRNTRLIWGLRCSDMNPRYYGFRLNAVIRACATLSGLPDLIISNSAAGQAFHVALGYPADRFAVIPNGIDVDRFRPDPDLRAAVRAELNIRPDERVVAHVARVDPMKDHTCLDEALRTLPNVKALLIGQGTENLAPRPGIFRLGRRDDVPRLLNAADIVVSSSAFGEGFSNAVAEGMASGLPAVATDTGDARIIVGDTGIVVPPRNPAALADGIGKLLAGNKSDLCARSAAARLRIVNCFSLQRAVAAFHSLYGEA